MLDLLLEPWAMPVLGLAGGLLLGLAARIGGFCTLGAVEDALYGNRYGKIGMWFWALGLAIFITALGKAVGWIDPALSLYAIAPQSWLAAILGGLMFGYGMALAGTCGFTALARFGSGDLRAFVILLVIGISAYIAIAGPLAHIRIYLTGTEPMPGFLDEQLAKLSGIAPFTNASLIALLLAAIALAIREFRESRKALFWASTVALAIAGGWMGTSYAAMHGFELSQSSSHSFSAPIGQTLLYLMTATGGLPGFGVGSVIGVIAGALLGSLFLGRFSWEACDDPRELSRQIFGAFLMGTGAVLALGCSLGQGLSGLAILSMTAPIVLAAIIIGAVTGIKQLVHGLG